MKAAVLEAAGQPLRVREIAIAAPGPGQVRVRVHHCGVCHSDLSIVDGTFPSPCRSSSGMRPRVWSMPSVSVSRDLQAGDHVVLTPCPPCGTCYWCVRGEPTVCVNASAIQTNTFADGSTGLSLDGAVVYRGVGVGAFAEYVLTPATGAVKIAADVPLDVACVIGCAVQTGVGAVLNTARVEEGATVLVMGLGGIGLSHRAGRAARRGGAHHRLRPGRRAARDRRALRRHRRRSIRRADDVMARVMELTGVGADYAFDAVGRGSLIQTGLAATRTGGTTVCVGAPPMDDAVTIAMPALFVISEKKLLGCALGSSNSLREIPRLVALWQAGRLDLEGLITARRPLAEINAAMDDLRASRGIRTALSLVG